MTAKEFVYNVRDMRDMQKLYFKTRNLSVLDQAREREREVDNIIANFRFTQLEFNI